MHPQQVCWWHQAEWCSWHIIRTGCHPEGPGQAGEVGQSGRDPSRKESNLKEIIIHPTRNMREVSHRATVATSFSLEITLNFCDSPPSHSWIRNHCNKDPAEKYLFNMVSLIQNWKLQRFSPLWNSGKSCFSLEFQQYTKSGKEAGISFQVCQLIIVIWGDLQRAWALQKAFTPVIQCR